MSYGIVRVQKMGAGSVKGIQIHDLREKEGISHTNKDIDWSRTKHNYDLCPAQNSNFTQAVKKRISELNLKRAVRKDAVVMAQVLVTSDNAFFTGMSYEQQKQFFEDSYSFLADRYGHENIISAVVHLDERTPHMHFNFVPVTADGRLSAKAVLTRQSLIEQQDKFYEQVGKKYGLKRGERGGIKKHLETAEFKKATLEQEIKSLENQIQQSKETLKSIEDTYKGIDEINAIPAKKALLTRKVVMEKEDYEKLKGKTIELIKQNQSLQIATQEALRHAEIAQNELKQWQGGLASEIVKSAQSEKLSMKIERAKYNAKIENMENRIKLAEHHLRQVPAQNKKYLKDLVEYGMEVDKTRNPIDRYCRTEKPVKSAIEKSLSR